MRSIGAPWCGLLLLTALAAAEPAFQPMFNGTDLSGWEGKPGGWYVEDGAITAESTPEKPVEKHHYLVWQGGSPGDFVLRFQYKITGPGGNSGVQFRSEIRPDWDTWGYQADIEAGHQWTGCLFQHDRNGVVMRGFKAKIAPDGTRTETQFADPAALLKAVKQDAWNTYEIRAEGHHITLRINDVLMCEVEDHDATYFRDRGIIALQMHPGPPMKIQFKALEIKQLD